MIVTTFDIFTKKPKCRIVNKTKKIFFDINSKFSLLIIRGEPNWIMKVMPTTSSKRQDSHSSRGRRKLSKSGRKKRKLSWSSVEDCETYSSHKRQKRDALNKNFFCESLCDVFPKNSFCESRHKDRLVIEKKFTWNRGKPFISQFKKKAENDSHESLSLSDPCLQTQLNFDSKCWIHDLPQEILLKIFSYLPLGMLLHTIPQICKRWEILALDWTLWKTVEDLTVKNMVISTSKLKTLLKTIPKLKKLELILSRNDTEELLRELFETHQNLEVLKLDRCSRSTLQMNILSQTVTSILEFCPKLRTIIMTDTYFHSKNFYRCLAKKFRTIERINVTCTSKSEMNVFMENLRENISEVEFQKVPMMGRAAGKQIYWGPILGLVVRPIPTSPFHQQYNYDNYPNYAF